MNLPARVAEALLSEADARNLTEQIKSTVEGLWSLLLRAFEQRAWSALGYESWQEYIQAEFRMSRSRSYQLLDQGRVIRALTAASGVSTSVDITEAVARKLKPVLPAVTENIRTRIEAGEDPAAAVLSAAKEIQLDRALDRLPTDERDIAKTLVTHPGISHSKSLELVGNLVEKPTEERVRLYGLYGSPAERERDLALTEVANMPPMPHPAFVPLKAAMRELRAALECAEGPEREPIEEMMKLGRQAIERCRTTSH